MAPPEMAGDGTRRGVAARSVRLKVAALREAVGTSLWFVPGSMVVGMLLVAAGTLAADRNEVRVPIAGFSGSPDSARSVLSAIATSIVSLTALVFSVTVVVLQLASSQYSPRVLRTFLRDRRSQLVLGVFLSTFAYTLVTLRAVRGSSAGEPEAFVPHLSVGLSFLLTLVSLALFVFYVNHIAQSMQSSSIVAEVAKETIASIETLYPTVGDDVEAPVPEPSPSGETRYVIASHDSGYLQGVDEDALFELACAREVTVRLVPTIGDFVSKGTRLFEVPADAPDELDSELHSAVSLGKRRTMQQDAAFGFRQLVDIAEKALSPGVNDPTTAVQAIDRLEELLVLLAPRSLPSAARSDDDGTVRVVLPRPGWESYVRLAFDEIRQYGEGSIQVMRRLRSAIEDLLLVVPPRRRDILEKERDLLAAAAERGFEDRDDVKQAKRVSGHG